MTEMGGEIEAALARVAELDFTMLKKKLGEEKGWSPEQQEEVEGLYRRFLALNIAYPDRKICPTGPVDEFWHAHILDTLAYARDCEYLFGHYLHHYPYFGMRGPEDYAALQTAFDDSRARSHLGHPSIRPGLRVPVRPLHTPLSLFRDARP